jgi:hypothetical protein
VAQAKEHEAEFSPQYSPQPPQKVSKTAHSRMQADSGKTQNQQRTCLLNTVRKVHINGETKTEAPMEKH